MSLNSHTALMALTMGLILGCTVVDSDQVDPETVHMTWWGEYDEPAGRMQWRSRFNVGGDLGTYLDLSGQSEARVNGDRMGKDEPVILNMVNYTWTRLARDPENPNRDYVLEYVDTQGKPYTNTVSLPPRVRIDPSQSSRVSRLDSFLEVRWRTDARLTSEDRITVNLSTTGTTLSAYDDYAHGSSGKVVFTGEQLRQLKVDRGRFRVCVSRQPRLSEAPPRGGDIRLSYCSLPKSVEIVQ